MHESLRFAEAIQRIDDANGEDPRRDLVDGTPRPRELLFATRVYEWIEQLVERPSQALLLAARGHTLCRWEIPRERYARDPIGYREWRDACARHHAGQAAGILRDVGYDDAVLQRVQDLILRAHFPQDPDARALEDADCLAFLEIKLRRYLDDWDDAKMIRILRGTLGKMTPQARARAAGLDLSEREQDLLRRAAE